MIDPQDVAEKIRIRRKDLGITQTELAERAGTSLSTITRIEQGRCLEVSFGTIARVLRAVSYDIHIELGISNTPDEGDMPSIEQHILDRYYFGKKA